MLLSPAFETCVLAAASARCDAIVDVSFDEGQTILVEAIHSIRGAVFAGLRFGFSRQICGEVPADVLSRDLNEAAHRRPTPFAV